MKKLIIAAVILLATTAQSFAGPIVSIHFEIGRKSIGCSKFGICDAGVDVSWKLSSMQIDENSKTLIINFHKELTAGKEEYFQGQKITFEESVILPSDVVKALGYNKNITIKANTYKLQKTRTGYQIIVPIN